jgi:hypothetical protein
VRLAHRSDRNRGIAEQTPSNRAVHFPDEMRDEGAPGQAKMLADGLLIRQ